MLFKQGKLYQITRLDARGNSDDERVYKAKFYRATDNLIIFDKGPYMVCEKKKNYRKTWKVRML